MEPDLVFLSTIVRFIPDVHKTSGIFMFLGGKGRPCIVFKKIKSSAILHFLRIADSGGGHNGYFLTKELLVLKYFC
jgi:hypothetical protein